MAAEERKRVIALGFFDGVHLGHGALLRRVSQTAGRLGLVPAAVTFDHHPKDLIPGAEKPLLLTTPREREALMARLYGIEELIVLPFDAHMRDMDWRDFVTEILVKQYRASHLAAGHDFRFGRGGAGTGERLEGLCRELGLGCDIVGQVELDGVVISSTYIRSLIQAGELERASRFLGHPHALSGTVVHGKGLGGHIGIPTANVAVPPGVLIPAFGVYAAKVWVGEQSYLAAANVGVRPTVEDGNAVSVEPWLLDFDGNLYGQSLRVEFFKRLRGERRFSSLDELKSAAREDADRTRAYFNTYEKRA